MKIAVIAEGMTERKFIEQNVQAFLKTRLAGQMPSIKTFTVDGLVLSKHLKKQVGLHLDDGYHAVIALTDVYTGANPPTFTSADDAKAKMRSWVGEDPRFHPHAAQYDFEAWLLPFWERIQKRAGSNQAAPGPHPEQVNHGNPPAKRLKELFERGTCKRSYKKTIDGLEILKDQDISVALQKCPELKSFVNTILRICGGSLIA